MLMKKDDGKQIRAYIDKAVKENIDSYNYRLAHTCVKNIIDNVIIGEFYDKIRENVSDIMAELYESKVDNRLKSYIKKHIPPNIIYVNECKAPPKQLAPLNVNEFVIPPKTSGIYFLCKDDRIVYIGQAYDLSKRIPQHVGSKNFDRVFYMNICKDDLTRVESELIDFYQPDYNKMRITKESKKHERQKR